MMRMLLLLIFVSISIAQGSLVDELLKNQNVFRALHNSPPLAIDAELAKKASIIAEQALKNGKFFAGTKEMSDTNTEMICSSFQRNSMQESAKEIVEAW